MTTSETSRCPRCAAPVGSGESRCPNGHDLSPDSDRTTSPQDDEGAAHLKSSSSEDGLALWNTIFECRACERLIETQRFHERLVEQRYCPWCGRSVSPLVGRDIDGYRVESVLGQGGFGLVYLASNITEPKMKAVIKLLRPEMVYCRRELIRVFVEEARLTEEIGQTCWNVVRVSNVREKPWPYFFMEYLRGRTLDTILQETGPGNRIPVAEAKGYLRGIARALVSTHAHGRVHRDLKPLNIMVIRSREISRPEEKIKLLDFGLAMKIAGANATYLRSEISGSSISAAGRAESPVQNAGTPEYMPPEAFNGINELGGDIYSFGVTAYEILTSERPWEDPPVGTDRFLYWRECHLKRPPRPIRDVRPETPKWLSRVLMRCLEKDPRKRIPAAEKLLEDLREPISLWVWASSAAGLLLVALLLAFILFRSPSSSKLEWSVFDEPRAAIPNRNDRGGLEVWVRSERDLPEVKLAAFMSGNERPASWSSSATGVLCVHREDGAVQIELPPDRSLLERPIVITGRGRSSVSEGRVLLREDPRPPEVSAISFRDRSSPSSAERPGEGKEERLNLARGELVVHIREEHLREDSALLHVRSLDPHDSSIPDITGELVKDGERWVCSFPRLVNSVKSTGTYEAWASAMDLAGNAARSEKVSFRADDAIEIGPVGREGVLIADRKVFFDLSTREKLEVSRVSEKGSSSPLSFELYRRPTDLRGSFDLAQRSSDLGPHSSPVLEEPGSYLLALPARRDGPRSFLLYLKDFATPPNRHQDDLLPPLALEWEPPDFAFKVRQVSLKINGQVLDLAAPVPGEPFVLMPPSRRAGLSEVRIETVPEEAASIQEKVHRAECRLGERSFPGAVGAGAIAFDLAALGDLPDGRDRLEVRLVDPLGDATAMAIEVPVDTVPPEFEVQTISRDLDDPEKERTNPADYHHVAGGKDIRLEVIGTEELSAARVKLKGSEMLPLEERPDPTDPRKVVFRDLDRLHLDRDGSFGVLVGAADLAGNETPREVTIVIDSGGPSFELVVPQEARKLVFESSKVSADIRDGNEIDYVRVKPVLLFEFRDPATGKLQKRTIPIPRPRSPPMHEVPLDQIPPGSKGTMTVKIQDRLGLPGAMKSWEFEDARSERWPETLSWKGMDWVLVGSGKSSFYIGRHEVSNALYGSDPAFLKDGEYVDPGLRRKHTGPEFWRKGGKPPLYSRGGKPVSGDQLPVVGISRAEAQAFADAVFPGARLPTWREWEIAAGKRNSGRYPWNDVPEGLACSNCLGSCDREPMKGQCVDTLKYFPGSGKEPVSLAHNVVKVSFDPFPTLSAESRKRLGYSGEILHLIGNVGEIVVLDPEREECGIAGGDFEDGYEDLNIHDPPRPFQPTHKTGFRLVIPLDQPRDEGFIDAVKKAKASQGTKR